VLTNCDKLIVDQRVRLAYQPPANSTFVSEQTSHQQPANSTFLSEQTSTSHQPPAKRTGRILILPSFNFQVVWFFVTSNLISRHFSKKKTNKESHKRKM
jgi:hypothetical protein